MRISRTKKLYVGIPALIVLPLLPIIFQDKMLYITHRYADVGSPTESDPHYTPYRATDGHEGWGYLIRPDPPLGATKSADAPSSATLASTAWPRFYMVFNGNNSTSMLLVGYYKELAKRTGCGFYVTDYRGYGYSPGHPSEKGLAADAIGAYDTMREMGMFEEGVGVMGHSLGGGASYALAVQRPVERLITFGTFTSIDAMARITVPWPYYHFCWSHYPNDQRLKELLGRPDGERPRQIFIFHGKKDEFVPFSMGEKLAATPGKGLTFIPDDEANHEQIHEMRFEDVVAILKTDCRKVVESRNEIAEISSRN